MRNNDLPDLLHPRPFMYGIRTPDGTAWLDEYCVDRDRDELESGQVAALNEGAEDGDGRYEAVALYTADQVEAMLAGRVLSRTADDMVRRGHGPFTAAAAPADPGTPLRAEAVSGNCAFRVQLAPSRTEQGSTAFTRQRRYIVLKNSDLHALALAGQLRAEDMDVLTCLSDAADRLRTVNGRPALRCVVVESDWPEYETTYAAIEKRTGAGHE